MTFDRWVYNQYRRNLRRQQRPLKDRQLHTLERALYFWPMFAYLWVKGRRRPEHIPAPEGAIFMGENEREDA